MTEQHKPPEFEKLPDEELMKLIVQGDEAAVDALYKLRWGEVARYAKRQIRTRKAYGIEPEDIAEDVFIVILERCEKFDPKVGTVVRWMRGVAKNLISDAIRKNQRLQQHDFSFDATSQDDSALDAIAVKIQRIVTVPPQISESELFVHELLEQLNQGDREIIVMRDGGGLTFAEIGQSLEISEGAARQRHHRAKERIKDRGDQKGDKKL